MSKNSISCQKIDQTHFVTTRRIEYLHFRKNSSRFTMTLQIFSNPFIFNNKFLFSKNMFFCFNFRSTEKFHHRYNLLLWYLFLPPVWGLLSMAAFPGVEKERHTDQQLEPRVCRYSLGLCLPAGVWPLARKDDQRHQQLLHIQDSPEHSELFYRHTRCHHPDQLRHEGWYWQGSEKRIKLY